MKTLATILVALPCWLAAPAFAEEKAPTIAEERRALVVSVDVGTSGLSPEEVRAAVAKELGVQALSEGDASGSLSVRVLGARVRVTFTRGDGERIEREVELPRETASRVEVIALLAGNLARDEAAALLAELKRSQAKTQATPATDETSAPKLPLAAAPPPRPTAAAPSATADTTAAAPTAAHHRPPLAANLSLFHPLSIVADSERYTLDLELGLAYGRIGALSGFGLNVGHLRVDGVAEGVGVAGLWSRIDGDAVGAFGSGILSQGGGALRGAELSGIAALRRGDVDGFQGAGVVGKAARVRGAQVGGAVSWAEGPVKGAQLAGGLSFARGDIDGGQLALVNIGGNVRGAQVGLVNIGGDVRGSQLGVVNISDRVDGVPLGVVNVVKNGRTQAVAWADTLVVANAAVKYLNGPIFTLVGAGHDGGDGVAAAFALGGHVRITQGSYVELDALYRYLTDFDDTDADPDRHLSAARVVIGAEGLGPAGAFVGGGVSHDVDSHGRNQQVRAYGVAGVSLF